MLVTKKTCNLQQRVNLLQEWMNIRQIPTEDLRQLHWAEGSREATSEWPAVLHIRFCSLANIFKWQLGIPVKTWEQYTMQGRVADL